MFAIRVMIGTVPSRSPSVPFRPGRFQNTPVFPGTSSRSESGRCLRSHPSRGPDVRSGLRRNHVDGSHPRTHPILGKPLTNLPLPVDVRPFPPPSRTDGVRVHDVAFFHTHVLGHGVETRATTMEGRGMLGIMPCISVTYTNISSHPHSDLFYSRFPYDGA